MQVSCQNQEMLRPEATLELELERELELEAVVSSGTVSWLWGTCGFTTCLPSTVYSISVVPLGCSLRTTACTTVLYCLAAVGTFAMDIAFSTSPLTIPCAKMRTFKDPIGCPGGRVRVVLAVHTIPITILRQNCSKFARSRRAGN